ncbi:MAG: phospholipase D-like domain-containing protein, partial [Candidatus Margulisiibacteriota bacterium]
MRFSVKYKDNSIYLYRAQDIKRFGAAVPRQHLQNAHSYLSYLGIKLEGAESTLKKISLSEKQIGQLYLKLFVNQVDSLNIKPRKFRAKDLTSLNPKKISFKPREGLLIEQDQGAHEISQFIPEELIAEAEFSYPRDITKREKMIATIIEKLDQAKKSIYLAIYAFTNEELCQALINAKNRGVDVRVIRDSKQTKNSQYEALKKAGIEVIKSDLTLHHKFCVIDESGLFMGSFNWTRANVLNYEDYAYFSGKGEIADLVQSYKERFLKLYRMFSLGLGTIVSETLEKNPFLQGLEFGHTIVPLAQVKEDEILLSRITKYDYQKLIDLLKKRKGQYEFRLDKEQLLEPLFEAITPESNYLIEAFFNRIYNGIPLRFFYEAASPSKKYHKSHVRLLEHNKEVVAWGRALSKAQQLPDQTQNEIDAAAACHNIYCLKGNNRAKLTADRLGYKLKDFIESQDEDAQESLERALESIRNCLHVWGGTPLDQNNSINDWDVATAKHLATQPNIFILESESLSPKKEQEIIGQLVERPFPDPRKIYLPLLESDKTLLSRLRQVTGRDSFFDLAPEDERILDTTYSLLCPFLLSVKDAAKSDKEQERAILKKKKTIKTVLMASLLVRYGVQGINRLADKAQSIKMKLTPRTNRLLWPICIANWIAEQKNMRVFSHGDVRRALEKIETKEREWVKKEHDPSELRRFSLDLQEVVFDELSHEFVPEVEEQLRSLISSRYKRYKIKFEQPIASEVVKWMIRKAGTLQAERIYEFFLDPLKTKKARRQFIEALRSANEDGFDVKVMQELELELIMIGLGEKPRKTANEISTALHNAGLTGTIIDNILEDLRKFKAESITIREIYDLLMKQQIPLKTIKVIIRSFSTQDISEILADLARGHGKELRKTAKEISTVLHNTGIREAIIENILEDVYKLGEKRITIQKINDLLVKHKIPLKTIKIIYRSLLEIDPRRAENPIPKLDRILMESEIDEEQRKGMAAAFKEIIRREAERRINNLSEQSGSSPKLPPGRILPEFNALGKALFDMGKTNINETLAWFRSTRDLSFRDYPKEAMIPAIKIVNQTIKRGERILVYGDARLNGALSVALLVETLRDLGMPKELIGYHIPDMSFGLTTQEIQQKYEEGYQTIISTDADIKSGEAIAEAKKLGMKVIIIDEQPYKFARALLDDARIPKGGLFLDLATLGALTKVGPLTQKDRNIVHWGLRVLNSLNRNIGLDTLIEIRGIKEKPMDGLGVRSQLIPTLEIGGEEVVKLLLAEDKTEALVQVEKLMSLEKEERAKDKEMQPGRK